MALQLDTIRATVDRVAASHGVDLVDLEFTGGPSTARSSVFLEKDAGLQAAQTRRSRRKPGRRLDLPKGVPVELLSGVTHEDCASFATDFGTVLDVEDLIPGAAAPLEVSSPGLERKLLKPADYDRFRGSLIKLQTFTPVEANRHFTGRPTAFDGTTLISTSPPSSKSGEVEENYHQIRPSRSPSSKYHREGQPGR